MARKDVKNRAHLWADVDIDGLLMMRADFTTHEFTPHVHDEVVIAVTECGGSEFSSRGIRDYAEPETVLAFNPGEPHSGRMAGHAGWRYRAFYLNDAAMQRIAGDFGNAPDALPDFLTNKLIDRQLYRRFLSLHEVSERNGGVLRKQTELLSVMAMLFARHGNPSPTFPDVGTEKSVVYKVRDYLADNYSKKIVLDELAQLADMTTYHLIRSFNKELGLAPHAYLTQIRVRKARELIQQGISPAEAATEAGFYDQSALSRNFKRTYGVTPGQFLGAYGEPRRCAAPR